MAIDTEAKRWSMLAHAAGPPRIIVFNPDTSGLVSIEQITVLQYYGGNAWDAPSEVAATDGYLPAIFSTDSPAVKARKRNARYRYLKSTGAGS